MRTGLQSVHKISYYEAYKMSSILADSYYVLLFTKGPDNVFNMIQLSGTEWQFIHPAIIARQGNLMPLVNLPSLQPSTSSMNQNMLPSYVESSHEQSKLKSKLYPQI
jgi:hypothetical protein